MSGIDKIITDTNKRALLIAALIVFVAWYFCLIIIPAFPNGTCPVGISGAASFGGSSGGGTSGGGACPNMCSRGHTFDTGTQCCTPDPEPYAPYCSTGIKCPPGGYDTYYGTCRCGTGYTWDTGIQMCCPPQVL